MTQIPDAAVQAIEKIKKIAGSFINEGSRDYPQEVCSALKNVGLELLDAVSALPHLPLGYEVKKLEWVSKGQRHSPAENLYTAETVFGLHMIAERQDTARCVAYTVPNIGFSHEADSIHDAKSAAQADFERRVRECIVAKPVDVAAVRRQAL